MRTAVPIAVAIALLAVCCAWAQQGAMYDYSYSGPRNAYGQPTFKMPPQYRRANAQARAQPGGRQQAPNGVVPMAWNQVRGFGGYLWSYMPAPLRGQPNQYVVQPNSGQVTVNFVPGAR